MKKPILILLLLLVFAELAKAQNTQKDTVKSASAEDELSGAQPAYVPKAPDNSPVFQVVMQEPTFPGGVEKLNEYINGYLAKHAVNFKATVVVSFIVEKDGSLSDVRALKGDNKDANALAIDMMQNCPKWKPGFQNRKAVRVEYSIPLSFNGE